MRDRAVKKEAIRAIRAGERTQAEVARELGVSRQAVWTWLKPPKRKKRHTRAQLDEIVQIIQTRSPREENIGQSESEWSWGDVDALCERIVGAPASEALRAHLAAEVAIEGAKPTEPSPTPETPLVLDAPTESGSKAAVDYLRGVLLGAAPLPEPEAPAEPIAAPVTRRGGPSRSARERARAERKRKKKGKRKRHK